MEAKENAKAPVLAARVRKNKQNTENGDYLLKQSYTEGQRSHLKHTK